MWIRGRWSLIFHVKRTSNNNNNHKHTHSDDQGWYYDHGDADLSCDGKEHCALDLELQQNAVLEYIQCVQYLTIAHAPVIVSAKPTNVAYTRKKQQHYSWTTAWYAVFDQTYKQNKCWIDCEYKWSNFLFLERSTKCVLIFKLCIINIRWICTKLIFKINMNSIIFRQLPQSRIIDSYASGNPNSLSCCKKCGTLAYLD